MSTYIYLLGMILAGEGRVEWLLEPATCQSRSQLPIWGTKMSNPMFKLLMSVLNHGLLRLRGSSIYIYIYLYLHSYVMVLSSSQKGIIVICCDWSQSQEIQAYILLLPVSLKISSSKNKQANRPRAKSQHEMGKVAAPQQGTPLAADRRNLFWSIFRFCRSWFVLYNGLIDITSNSL